MQKSPVMSTPVQPKLTPIGLTLQDGLFRTQPSKKSQKHQPNSGKVVNKQQLDSKGGVFFFWSFPKELSLFLPATVHHLTARSARVRSRGTGKTLLAKSLAADLGCFCELLAATDLVGTGVGESEAGEKTKPTHRCVW